MLTDIHTQVETILAAYEDWMSREKAVKMLQALVHQNISTMERQYVRRQIKIVKGRRHVKLSAWDYVED
jgi:hypothetical protein